MFSRSSGLDTKAFVHPKVIEQPQVATIRPIEPAVAQPSPPPDLSASGLPRSVIGNDLTIHGQDLRIVTKGSLQIDGDVQGDIQGAEVIVGEKGRVTGTIAAETIIIQGKVAGVMRGSKVALASAAIVEGDIHHQQLVIETGAQFEGRSRRPKDASDLHLTLDTPANDLPPMPIALGDR